MLRKTVAIAGLIVIVASSLFVTEGQSSDIQAAAFAFGPLAASAYLPLIIKDGTPAPPPTPEPDCSPCYPDVCIPPPPPDLDCGEILFCQFRVVDCDPHGFDGDEDGIGWERCD